MAENANTGMDVRAFLAISLDGFIAREDGGLDWLDAANASLPEGEDCGFGEFMNATDVLVMGRNTFDAVLSFGAEVWGYGAKPVVVLTHRPLEVPPAFQQKGARINTMQGEPGGILEQLAQQGHRSVYVDGGHTIARFAAAHCLHQLTLTLIPVALGDGILLFGPALKNDLPLSLQHHQVYEGGYVQLSYRVERLRKCSGAGP